MKRQVNKKEQHIWGVDIQFYNQTNESVESYEAMITKVVHETIKQEQLANEMLECSFISLLIMNKFEKLMPLIDKKTQ